MLDPQNRTLLRDTLRPPPGYDLDRAYITTFSLDLMALLCIPVSFTIFGLKDHDGPPSVDPLALLEALRRYAAKVTVFCQAGQIHVPRHVQLLLGYVEGTVHAVQAPRAARGGVFHPKLSLLRYVPQDDEGGRDRGPVLYRLLCSSRNLTFDRSWDTLLVLDGGLVQQRKNAFSRNRPLSRFVAALPAMTVDPLNEQAAADVARLADELLRVDFAIPEGFEDLEFCPLGIGGAARWPILQHRRTLAMAPYVQDGFVRRFADADVPLGLIARLDSLDELSLRSLQSLFDARYMNFSAEPIPDDADEPAGTAPQGGTPSEAADTGAAAPAQDADRVELSPSLQLHGLHAKLFLGDDGWNAHVWTGSANATTAAFERNVEFLVHLVGKKSRFGVDAFLAPSQGDAEGGTKDRALRFADLLVRYRRDEPPTVDATRRALERLLDEARYAIAGGSIVAQVEQSAAGTQSAQYRVTLVRSETKPLELAAGISVVCRPLTLRAGSGVRVTCPIGSVVAVFEPLVFEAITSFYAFELTARLEQAELSCSFVVNLPLRGAPPDRAGRLLLSLLRNRDQLLRYLLLLLADDEEAARRVTGPLAPDHHNGHGDGPEAGFGMPLLEPLLAALDRHPARVDQIHRLIEDLRHSAEGRQLVSEEFLSIWEPIWAARKPGGTVKAAGS